jgi:mono/diheme cytochrome c family protein
MPLIVVWSRPKAEVTLRRSWLVLSACLVLVGIVAGVQLWRRPELTAAMRGQRLARELGCFGCHGPEGLGGVADPTSPSGEVPDWGYTTAKQYLASEEELRAWILDGMPESQAWRREHHDRELLVPMPAYRDELAGRELDDLVAYFLAVSGWREEYSEECYQGRQIALRLGCFGCHGPSGMGGIANPGSFKGHVPAWDGEEFVELVRDEDELREWILYGRIERLWQNPAARHFLEGQRTPMPAYHDHLSDGELDKLVTYVRSLREEAQDQDSASAAAEVIGLITTGGS